MAKITTKREGDFVINTAVGDVALDQIASYIYSNIDGWAGQPVIWDLTQLQLDDLPSAPLRHFASQLAKVSEKRAADKTAVVAPHDVQFGIARMFEAFSDLASNKNRVAVFRSIAAAKAWLVE